MRACLVLLLALGCNGSDETAPNVDPAEIPPGLPPDMPCAPAEWMRDGVCIPAGVPSDGCGAGFVHDGDRGCEPVLPQAPCARGFMAVPGETMCREVAPCATGKWGDIPVDGDTEHVDASYAGTDSDGSALKPWTTVQAGVDAASAGAVVAIAEGSYLEDVVVSGKAVRLWGVCPRLVAIVGTGAALGGVQVLTAGSGSEVHNLAIRGNAIGFAQSGALGVLLERVWVHDNASRGVVAQDDLGPTGVTLRGALVEQNREFGIFGAAVELDVEASVVRGTLADAQGAFGSGVSVKPGTTLHVRGSVIEQNRYQGVFVEGSEALVEASVIRDIEIDGRGTSGRGIAAQADPTTGAPSTVTVRTSLVERCHDVGLYVAGAGATVESTVLRDTAPDGLGRFGRGVTVQAHASGSRSTLVLRTSLVERNHQAGVFAGGDVTVEASVVRDTQPAADARFGRGINAQPDQTGTLSKLLVLSSLVERNHTTGVFGAGDVTVEASIVRDTQPDALGSFGRGVSAQVDPNTLAPSTLSVRSSIIERNHEAGVAVIGSVGTIETCVVSDTRPSPGWGAGEGIMVVSEPGPASATVTGTRIHQSALAALAAWGAHAAIGQSAFSCQAFDLDSEAYAGNAAKLEDRGGNTCGCPEPNASCKAVSAGLAAPQPLEPIAD